MKKQVIMDVRRRNNNMRRRKVEDEFLKVQQELKKRLQVLPQTNRCFRLIFLKHKNQVKKSGIDIDTQCVKCD